MLHSPVKTGEDERQDLLYWHGSTVQTLLDAVWKTWSYGYGK